MRVWVSSRHITWFLVWLPCNLSLYKIQSFSHSLTCSTLQGMLSFRCVVIIPQRTFNGPGAWVLVQSIARNTMGASSSSCADAKVKQCLQKCMPGLEAWSGRPEHSIHEVLQLTCHHKACASYPIIACAGRVQIPRTYRTKNDWFKIFEDCVDEILVEWTTSNDSLSKQWKIKAY